MPRVGKDSRAYPERPLVGVGGVVFEGESVLLVRRAREPGRGKWSIPGGAVRLGETLVQALEREMLEETGLAVKVVKPLEVVERIIPGDGGRVRYHYVLIDYLCRVRGGALRPGSDAGAAAFHPLEVLGLLNLTAGAEAVIRRGWNELRKRRRQR